MILNLTQHAASAEQVDAGVVDLAEDKRQELIKLLTFDTLPSQEEIASRAQAIADLAALSGEEDTPPEAAMIGGAPFLMASLENALVLNGIVPLYAFSRRESVEETQEDGSIRKTAVFRHLGFIDAR